MSGRRRAQGWLQNASCCEPGGTRCCSPGTPSTYGALALVCKHTCARTHTPPWSPGKAGLLLPTPPPPRPAPLRAAAMHTCAPTLSRFLHPLAAPLDHFTPGRSRETLRGWGQRVQRLSEPDGAGLGGFASAQTRGCAAGCEQRTERFQMEGRPRAALPK